MKKIMLAVVMLVGLVAPMHAAQNYSAGNLLLGIGVGAGTPSAYPLGGPQFTIHPSVELLVGTKGAWAFGVTVDSSINMGKMGLTGTLAPMFTTHYTILPRWDMYASIGLGLQMLPANGVTGSYNILVGFATGFNVIMTPAWIWNIGLAIHAEQFFGSTGIKIRFGDASKIQYRK